MNQKVAQALSAQFQGKMTQAVETLYQARLAQRRKEAALANARNAASAMFDDERALRAMYVGRLEGWQGKSWYTGV
jgi:hypothetical protein